MSKENTIINEYTDLKKDFKDSQDSDKVTDGLIRLFNSCIQFLDTLNRKQLKSFVQNKEYFSFEKEKKLSRSVNSLLFVGDRELIELFWTSIKTNQFSALTPEQITKACYTIAISFCCSIDILKSSDQKTPGTFFEILVGHLFSKKLGVKPRTQLDVLNLDMASTKLPTDFIFDLGTNKPKYHVPVKTSTRERVIQVWAHQRVLDGVYGVGRFSGLLTCIGETKLDHKSHEVIEICLPDQWKLYQLFIAQMKRIYYLDVPQRYDELNKIFPKINVRPFGEFFHESIIE